MSEDLENLKQKQLLAYARDLIKIHTAEKEKRKELEIERNKLKATLSSIKDGLVTLDINNTIIDANNTFTNIVGKLEEEIIGVPLKDCLIAEGWKELHHCLNIKNNIKEIIINPDKKRKRFFKIFISPVFDNKGKQEGLVLTFYDETQIERNKILKDEFTNIISHEIRTPLNIITGFLQILESSLDEHMDEEDKESIKIIIQNSDRLQRTIDEMMETAVLSSGFSSKREFFDLRDSIKIALNEVNFRLTESKIKIETHIPKQKLKVYGFIEMLTKAITHLIENAIVFSPEGSKISITLKEISNVFIVKIQDEGIGIPKDELNKVFDPYHQVEEHSTRTHDGLGLGLAIVKKIIIMHKGDITLMSDIGKGTTALLKIPKGGMKEEKVNDPRISELEEELLKQQVQTKRYAKNLAELYNKQKNISSILSKK